MEAATSDAQHAEMLERINQFNIVRESNATLRAECETYAKRSRELDAKLQALSTELEPVKEQARVAQAELQARDAQITRLEGESRRWQERNAQLLSKVSVQNHICLFKLMWLGSMIALTPLRSKH
jgi:nucleoprotein TPR